MNELYKKLDRQQAEIDELSEKLKEAMLMLDNVKYWDGCPDDYVKRLEALSGNAK